MSAARKAGARLSSEVAAALNECSELGAAILGMLNAIEPNVAEDYDTTYALLGIRELVRGIRDRLGRVLDGEATA